MRRCPQCGSSDLYQAAGGYLGSEYRCKRCGYRGAFIVESEEEMPHPDVPADSEGETRFDIPLWVRVLAGILLIILFWILLTGW
ncbi:hypothetical protein [Methanocalculus sp.]|uniref:hypothetical protein n=1 Tax=Methanocalculus sp. TaxID=2004547 RepID=UPI002721E4D4|nr:hypothetical protein [Methanocalculus sp.]MDO8840866.1 hypothetical protein [Methanocalculus sp.]